MSPCSALKTCPMTSNRVVLPVRREIPHVGEEVYAIGAPLSEKDLQDTVTKGIVSAWRPSDRMTRQSYIQADVDVQRAIAAGPPCWMRTAISSD